MHNDIDREDVPELLICVLTLSSIPGLLIHGVGDAIDVFDAASSGERGG